MTTRFEAEHNRNLEMNGQVLKLIETAADGFDLDIFQCLFSLVNKISRHRGVSREAARKIIVIDLLKVEKWTH